MRKVALVKLFIEEAANLENLTDSIEALVMESGGDVLGALTIGLFDMTAYDEKELEELDRRVE